MSTDNVKGTPIPDDLPPNLATAADALLAARGDARKLKLTFDGSPVPMVMLDDDGRYLDMNLPARLVAHRNLAEIRGLKLSDLAPPEDKEQVEQNWRRLRDVGYVTGPYERKRLDGTRVATVYVGLADVVPGWHVFAYAPADWSYDEPDGAAASLTPREREVLELAAEGLSGPQIADRLTVSPATVKTHLANIYDKLEVGDRAAAVATALRRRLIA